MADEEVKYVEEGEPGKTCAECKMFEPTPNNPSTGKCMGYDVQAKGSCNYFQAK